MVQEALKESQSRRAHRADAGADFQSRESQDSVRYVSGTFQVIKPASTYYASLAGSNLLSALLRQIHAANAVELLTAPHDTLARELSESTLCDLLASPHLAAPSPLPAPVPVLAPPSSVPCKSDPEKLCDRLPSGPDGLLLGRLRPSM